MLDQTQRLHAASGIVMGGPWQLRHVPVCGVAPSTVIAAAFDALQRVDDQMSTYKPSSDLMRLNGAPLHEWIAIPQEMFRVMHRATGYTERTDGAFDITMGAIVNAWGFGPDAVPDDLPNVADTSSVMSKYALRSDPPTIMKHADIAFDLSALAKGYAVDLAAQAVAELGVDHFLIEAAGEAFAVGMRPDGTAWKIGLELPVPGEPQIYDHVNVSGLAIATSGGYRQSTHIAGRRYNHCIDPLRGHPTQGPLLSVTVIHQTCIDADALATALYVMGEKAGPDFAIKHNIAALFLVRVDHGLKEIRSDAFGLATMTPSDGCGGPS